MRNPRTKLQAENEKVKVNNRFIGMYRDVPGSELPDGAAWRNINCNDRNDCTEGRAGSRLYTEATKPSGVLYGRCDHIKSGLVISAYGTKIYTSDKGLTYFEEVFMMKNAAISGPCKIKEFNDDAVIIDKSGIYLLVLSDYFRYVRKMNIAVPTTLITDIAETSGQSPKIYGHRYLYSFMQRSGNLVGLWDRLTEGYPPIFESGTCKGNTDGKDYGECFFASACYTLTMGNILGDFVIPFDTDTDSLTITDIGIYRSKNIGKNTTPPGIGLGGYGNNPELCVWAKDIPVAKAIIGSQSGNTVIVEQGEITADDVGNTIYWYAGSYGNYTSATIVTISSPTTFTVSYQTTRVSQIAGIGHGRLFSGYQSGDMFFTSVGTPFLSTDEGCPIWLADGRVIWIKEYISSSQVRMAYAQEIENQAATIHPPTGNVFSRKYNDTVVDDELDYPGQGLIGLQNRIACKQPIYWPRRFYLPLPAGDIGHIDFGFLFTAIRDETVYYYSEVGSKKYTLGYYRADHQKETVETHIKEILTAGGIVTIFLSNQTRTISAQTASDVGNADDGESIFKIPQSGKVDNRGVVLWRSIAEKGGNIIAITNEPAVRVFNGTSWSEKNYAQNQVQKYIEAIDQNELIASIYIPGRFGGYMVWFKRWMEVGVGGGNIQEEEEEFYIGED